MATTTTKRTNMRYVRRRAFSRFPRSRKLLAWLVTQAARLAGSATADTFVTVAKDATGILTASSNLVGNVAATGILTFGANPLNTEIVTIDSKVYTFQTSLTDVDGNILIGAAATDSLDNLIAAINLDAGAGSLYATSMTLHPTVSGAAGAGDTMDATAKTRGTAGNSIVSTTDVTSGSWGAGSLAGGIAGDTVTVGSQVYTMNAAPLIDSADNVLVAGSASDTLDNLIVAVNAGAGEGTTYGTGTVVHPDVSFLAGAGDTIDATAKVIGTGGNSIATTETSGVASWANATLTGGVTNNGLTAATHNITDGEGPYHVTTSGTLPGGLALLINYWVAVVDSNTFTLRTGQAGGSVVVITTEGVGTQTITKPTDSEGMFDILRSNKPSTIEAATDIDDLS